MATTNAHICSKFVGIKMHFNFFFWKVHGNLLILMHICLCDTLQSTLSFIVTRSNTFINRFQLAKFTFFLQKNITKIKPNENSLRFLNVKMYLQSKTLKTAGIQTSRLSCFYILRQLFILFLRWAIPIPGLFFIIFVFSI